MLLIYGLWYDPETKTGWDFKKKESFTFEPVANVLGEGLRPFQYATPETAAKVRDFVASLIPELSVEIVDRAARFGGGSQLEISVADGKIIFGAGAIAQSLLRFSNNDVYAALLMQRIVHDLAK